LSSCLISGENESSEDAVVISADASAGDGSFMQSRVKPPGTMEQYSEENDTDAKTTIRSSVDDVRRKTMSTSHRIGGDKGLLMNCSLDQYVEAGAESLFSTSGVCH
jgi:hypothetical protein